MLVLFINCHKKTEQGQLRFRNFYKNIRALLEPTVYYGNDITETIRDYDNLQDYIYDEISFRIDERVKRKFESLEYVIIDGTCSFAPWNQQMDDVGLIIRKSIQDGKNLLCHGFGHFSSYYYLTTKFDKPYKIGKYNTSKNVDFEWDEQSGDIKLKEHRIGNSGIKITNFSRPFSDKSSHALAKGITLSSKFDYVIFDGKSGSKLLRNVSVPFSFYWKSKLFCTNKTISQAKADILLQTQNGAPIVFTHKQLLSVQGSCPQILKIIRNWFMDHTNRIFENDDSVLSKAYQTIAFQNKIEYRKALSSSASQLRSTSKIINRPQSSKFSTLDFEKPIIRCSGKYQTLNQRYLKEELQKKSLNFGRSRMNFKGKLNELQIANYVQRQPSRPPSNYKFREVQKDKWVGGRDFFNC